MAPLTSRVAGAAARMLLKSATVSTVADHGPLRTLELTGRALVGVKWVPGDKLRIHLDGFDLRTYTPTLWDASSGRTQLVAFAHGDGPGATWSRRAAVDDTCLLFGPQRSVRLDQCASAPILVGDETSFGLSAAWRTHRPDDPPVAELFEVTDAAAVQPVLEHHRIAPTELVVRREHDAHLGQLAELVAEQVRARPDAPLCLTGRAQTIAAVRRHLKAEGLRAGDTKVKAYWDPNRTGLD